MPNKLSNIHLFPFIISENYSTESIAVFEAEANIGPPDCSYMPSVDKMVFSVSMAYLGNRHVANMG